MTTDVIEIHEIAVKNIHAFIELLNEDLWNSNDDRREMGSVIDLPDEIEALDYDISRGIFNNLMQRFEDIFFIAESYNVSWKSYRERFYDHLVADVQILNGQDASAIYENSY